LLWTASLLFIALLSSAQARADSFFAVRLDGDGSILWKKAYSVQEFDYNRAVGLSADHGVYLNNPLHRVAPEGRLLWRWADPAREVKVVLERDGGLYGAGTLNPWTNNERMDVFKATPDGTVVWRGSNLPGALTALQVNAYGDVVTAGAGWLEGVDSSGLAAVAYDNDGALLWTAYPAEGPQIYADSIKLALDEDGGVYLLAGASECEPPLVPCDSWWVYAYDAGGAAKWDGSFTIGESGDFCDDSGAVAQVLAEGMLVDQDESAYVSSVVLCEPAGAACTIQKFDAVGQRKTIMALDHCYHLFLLGWDGDAGMVALSIDASGDARRRVIDRDGQPLEDQGLVAPASGGCTEDDYGYRPLMDGDGNIFFTGSSGPWGVTETGFDCDIFVVRNAPDGSLWFRIDLRPFGVSNEATSAVPDQDGGIYVLGYTWDTIPESTDDSDDDRKDGGCGC
jgi:hypothetical protein